VRAPSHLKAISRFLLVAFVVLLGHFVLLFTGGSTPHENLLPPQVVIVAPIQAVSVPESQKTPSSSHASGRRKDTETAPSQVAARAHDRLEQSPPSASPPVQENVSPEGHKQTATLAAAPEPTSVSDGGVDLAWAQPRGLHVMVARIQGTQTELGEGQLTVERDGAHYRSELTWKMPGILQPRQRLVSEGQVAEQFVPIRYTNTVASEVVDVELGWLDPLALVWQLRAMLQNTSDLATLPVGHTWTFAVQDGAGQQQWQWQLYPDDYLRLPGRALRAVRLSSAGNGAALRGVDLWFAPEMDWLPVRIKLTQNSGVVLDVMWQKTVL
jgi:hypothetical protein